MGLDATVGGPSANSYVTRSEAYDYFDDRLGAEAILEDLDEEKLDRALVSASLLLDYRMVWIGSKATETQALDWPRLDSEEEPIYAADTIPPRIKQAVYEMAKYLLSIGDPLDSAVLDSVQLSSLKIDFKETGTSRELIPDEVASILTDYGQRMSARPTLREVAVYR
jgi:hypothetical protein